MSFWLCSSSTLLFCLTHMHSFRPIVCTSCIYYFFFPIQPSFSPFSQALLCLISCPSKATYFTPAAELPHPIFFPFRNCGFPLISSTRKMLSSSIPPSSASVTRPVSSSQYPVPPEHLFISMILSSLPFRQFSSHSLYPWHPQLTRVFVANHLPPAVS